jgi:hypothetical protein
MKTPYSVVRFHSLAPNPVRIAFHRGDSRKIFNHFAFLASPVLSIDRKDVAMSSEDFGFMASGADHRPSAKAQV